MSSSLSQAEAASKARPCPAVLYWNPEALRRHHLLAVFIFRPISFSGWEADKDLVALCRDANRWSLYRQGIEFLPSAGENSKVRDISTWTALSNKLQRILHLWSQIEKHDYFFDCCQSSASKSLGPLAPSSIGLDRGSLWALLGGVLWLIHWLPRTHLTFILPTLSSFYKH